MSPRQPFRWMAIAGMIFGAILLVIMLAWQLSGLIPARWCAVTVATAKMADQLPLVQDCTTIILKMLEIKDHAIIGLLSALVIAFLVLVVRELRAKVSWTGPGGLGGSIGGESESLPFVAAGTITTPQPDPAPSDPPASENPSRE